MRGSHTRSRPDPARWLEELPGISDVVWAALTRLAGRSAPTTVLFTAAEERAGTTLLAAATAIGLAQHRRVPVCLVETNSRRPALARYLGLEDRGLSDVLDGSAELEQCLQEPRGCPGLLVLPSGTAREPAPGEFTTAAMRTTLARLELLCHFLILDTAPVLGHVETRLLLGQADASVLVLRARATLRTDAVRAHDILAESGTHLLGTIFNDAKAERPFGGDGGADRAYLAAVRIERPPVPRAAPTLRGPPVSAAAPTPAATDEEHAEAQGAVETPTNGRTAARESTPEPQGSEGAHRRQVNTLERRIAKLTLQLARTEAELIRLATLKDVDPGISSVYRSVQGVSPHEEALAAKHSLLKQIFQANLELKSAMARPH
ncbi:MAG TPA: hypothetical protein VMT18_06115 [Planctomycetota bacterium]|nr:hypothetical protein [Planctomycetota bacterium]